MTPRQFTPRPYQTLALEFMLQNPRNALWASMGMGKTSTTLTYLDYQNLIQPSKTLVLAPKRVAASTWVDEADKWNHLSNIKVQPILGTQVERIAALKSDANVHTINYENLPWLIETMGEDFNYDTIVADESTRLKSYRGRGGGKRAKALSTVAHTKAKRFIELTGTPSPNGLIDLWGQIYFLDAGERLGRSYTAFLDRWFKSISIGGNQFAKRYEPQEYAQLQIQCALRDICLTLDAKDYFDLGDTLNFTIEVELPSKARELYDKMEKEMFFEIANTEVEAMNAASRTVKCLQLANGAIYTDEQGNFHEMHDAKLQALESIVYEANGMPVLVAYHFKSDLERLLKAFPQGRHLDDNPQTIRDWNKGKIPVLFAHPASAGHGLNLQDGGNILAFFGHWWNLEEYQQIVERIGATRQAQAGYSRPVFIYHIVAKDTVDEIIMLRRESKREVQDLLLEAMKRKTQ
mgnify:CR=1 FL=1